jgi:hypothetical protein
MPCLMGRLVLHVAMPTDVVPTQDGNSFAQQHQVDRCSEVTQAFSMNTTAPRSMLIKRAHARREQW